MTIKQLIKQKEKELEKAKDGKEIIRLEGQLSILNQVKDLVNQEIDNLLKEGAGEVRFGFIYEELKNKIIGEGK